MLKRTTDIVLGTLLAVAATAPILVLAAMSAATLRRWPLFTQVRLGRGGRPFTIVKIRTLPAGTPEYATKDAAPPPTVHRHLAFVRRRHLDELPQLWLVPLGWMSLVGPRPKMPDVHEPADPEYRRMRESVRQGCTGLWQISVDADGIPGDTPQYDRLYVEQHPSLWLDLWVLWRTVLVIVGVGRLVTLDHLPRWTLTSTPRLLPSEVLRSTATDVADP